MSEVTETSEQLALELPAVRPQGDRVVVPLRFRISEANSRRGLAHVAELRKLLADRQAVREAAGTAPVRVPSRAA